MEMLAARYTRLQAEMQTLRLGDDLAAAAAAVEAVLPQGPLSLVSTSNEGAGLAAVCAARRSNGTTWSKIDLMAPLTAGAHEVVVIEPVDAGAAWRQALARLYPRARIVIASEVRQAVPAAA